MKKQRKDWKRISASALLAGTMVLSNLGTVIPVQASDTGVSVQDAGENLSVLNRPLGPIRSCRAMKRTWNIHGS